VDCAEQAALKVDCRSSRLTAEVTTAGVDVVRTSVSWWKNGVEKAVVVEFTQFNPASNDEELHTMTPKTIQDIMTKDVRSITRDLPITRAIEEMQSRGIRRMPVVGHNDHVIGLISLNDALIAMPKGSMFTGDSLEPIPTVNDVMTDFVYTIGPNDSVAKAARMMVNHKISCLPVLNDDRGIVGIVTESDIFRYVAEILPADEAEDGAEGDAA
jgi:CBS domain-containing protein